MTLIEMVESSKHVQHTTPLSHGRPESRPLLGPAGRCTTGDRDRRDRRRTADRAAGGEGSRSGRNVEGRSPEVSMTDLWEER